MKKIFAILFSLIISTAVEAAFPAIDIHTPNGSKSAPFQLAKVYFLPDWSESEMKFDGTDEKPCIEVCPQKTEFDCASGQVESYVNSCGNTCVRCIECYGCEEQGYILAECPDNGICSNDCCNKLYKLTGCNEGYVLDGSSCRTETCSENASVCGANQKCSNGVCVDKTCDEDSSLCSSSQTRVNKQCVAKDCNNTSGMCTATEKCQLQNGKYQCICSPICVDATDCETYGTPVANGCGGTCKVCGDDGTAVSFTFVPTAGNITLTMPTLEYSGLTPKYTIDWGDGTIDKDITTYGPSHTYLRTGVYEVKLTGTVGTLSVFSSSIAKYIVKINQFNLSSLRKLDRTFLNATNLTGSIPNLPINLINGYAAFEGRSGLTGNIPAFPTGLTLANAMFDGCTGLTGEIPAFPPNLLRANFMFQDCSGLTGSIPEFPSTLAYAQSMFDGCTNLTGVIPAIPSVLEMGAYMFRNCRKLTGIEKLNGQYPCQYLNDSGDFREISANCQSAVKVGFKTEWGGTCSTSSSGSGAMVCEICKVYTTGLANQCTGTTNDDQLMQCGEALCRTFPNEIMPACFELHEAYKEPIIQLLNYGYDPNQICLMINLCE